MGGATCQSEGFDSGSLSCNGDCSGFETSDCYNYVCGDGVVEGSEQCDDGNLVNGDGCSSSCVVELFSSPGDLNNDGEIKIDDGHLLMSRRMSGSLIDEAAEDVDCDVSYDYKDVLKLVDFLVGEDSINVFYSVDGNGWSCWT